MLEAVSYVLVATDAFEVLLLGHTLCPGALVSGCGGSSLLLGFLAPAREGAVFFLTLDTSVSIIFEVS